MAVSIPLSIRNSLDYLTNNLPSPTAAATTIASTTLSPPASEETLEDQLTRLWRLILTLAHQTPAHQAKLVALLTALSRLPDAATTPNEAEGKPLTIHDMRVWHDLPMLGWEAPPPVERLQRDAAIARIVNGNRFVARLVATHERVFRPHAWFALVTLRRALETPAAWIEVLGPEIYAWEEEERFGEVVKLEGEDVHVRSVAGRAERRMKEIEADRGAGGGDRR
ncbi:hypothetical protein BP00DRAFT_438829 [Aspergillus indologenus CBS 114.80]|uniref:Uncharacterized protein n=1 Tax=Aspergillus indologenus CBS 114.80 TaxID=1450541 RepID=A0A2V5IV91_9EURO|nr:hypothetical protein BP00DRAFT_438829 [Aspergillus indologenus CBS 114.80]